MTDAVGWRVMFFWMDSSSLVLYWSINYIRWVYYYHITVSITRVALQLQSLILFVCKNALVYKNWQGWDEIGNGIRGNGTGTWQNMGIGLWNGPVQNSVWCWSNDVSLAVLFVEMSIMKELIAPHVIDLPVCSRWKMTRNFVTVSISISFVAFFCFRFVVAAPHV